MTGPEADSAPAGRGDHHLRGPVPHEPVAERGHLAAAAVEQLAGEALRATAGETGGTNPEVVETVVVDPPVQPGERNDSTERPWCGPRGQWNASAWTVWRTWWFRSGH